MATWAEHPAAQLTGWDGIHLIGENVWRIEALGPHSPARVVSLELKAVSLNQNISPRNGRVARGQASADREEVDSAYRARMSTARAMLANDFMRDSPPSLAKLRLERGLSQHQLAKAMGTSQPHIAKIEAGNINIYWETAVRIADALGVTLEELRPLIKASAAHTKITTEEL